MGRFLSLPALWCRAATAGYAKGCLFLKSDAAAGTHGVYVNRGTTTSCDFVLATPSSAAATTAVNQTTVAANQAATAVNQNTSSAKLFFFENPAASGVGVHAALAESAVNAFPGPFTSPAIPRNLQCVFAAGWEGGDVNIVGTDYLDQPIDETFVSTPGATLAGSKIFKTVVSASKTAQAGAADTVTIQTGDKLGILADVQDAFAMLLCDEVAEAVTIDVTYNSFLPSTLPNGARDYKVLVNANHLHTQDAHNHTQDTHNHTQNSHTHTLT